jgi:hypothetical protein
MSSERQHLAAQNVPPDVSNVSPAQELFTASIVSEWQMRDARRLAFAPSNLETATC